ncbi:MAG TPA: hypothetical protein VM241_04895, partial [Candidatus Thermoplasmatota archaeon]|nr:hypothetical protein [Candidatus Thermoplasmatota archaeon]
VIMASQCINGSVNMNVYSTGRDLLQMGVLPAQDMTPEAAYIKMMWILGHTSDPKEVRKLFLTDLAGEMDAPVDLRAFVSAALPPTVEAK